MEREQEQRNENFDPREFVETEMSEEQADDRRDIEYFVMDAESKINEVRQKFNEFDTILIESKKMMNNLIGDLDSVRAQLRKQKLEQQRQMNEKSGFHLNCSQFFNDPSTAVTTIPIRAHLDTGPLLVKEAISRTEGPLTPQQLTDFLDDVRGKKNVISVVQKLGTTPVPVINQLFHLKNLLDSKYKEYVRQPGNRPKDFDNRLRGNAVVMTGGICLGAVLHFKNRWDKEMKFLISKY